MKKINLIKKLVSNNNKITLTILIIIIVCKKKLVTIVNRTTMLALKCNFHRELVNKIFNCFKKLIKDQFLQ